MLINQVIYDAKTGETRIEEIEVEDIVEELEPIQSLTTEERVERLENTLNELVISIINNDFENIKSICLNK